MVKNIVMAPSLLCRSVCGGVGMSGPTGQPAQFGMDGEVCVSSVAGRGQATSFHKQLLCLQTA